MKQKYRREINGILLNKYKHEFEKEQLEAPLACISMSFNSLINLAKKRANPKHWHKKIALMQRDFSAILNQAPLKDKHAHLYNPISRFIVKDEKRIRELLRAKHIDFPEKNVEHYLEVLSEMAEAYFRFAMEKFREDIEEARMPKSEEVKQAYIHEIRRRAGLLKDPSAERKKHREQRREEIKSGYFRQPERQEEAGTKSQLNIMFINREPYLQKEKEQQEENDLKQSTQQLEQRVPLITIDINSLSNRNNF